MKWLHLSFLRSFALIVFILMGMKGELFAQQKREIIIEHADLLRSLKKDGKDIRRLIGNVRIRHEETTVKCDSLYDYVGSNQFDAFGNVVIIRETSTLYGDTLNFDGNTKIGRVRGKVVRLLDEDVTLITKYLDFNTQANTVNYYDGGIITTSDSRFSSKRGKYFSNQKLFVFGGMVAYLDTDILLNTDSLEYNSNTELIKFFGPTQIYNEENYLYCEKGWHNRADNQSEFQINAYVDNGDQQMFGNTVFYDSNLGYSHIMGNACVIDTQQKLTIYGDQIYYYQDTEYTEVKGDPLAIYVSDQSDTLFLRADILIGKSIKDPNLQDSTLYNLLIGVGNVKFFRDDIQGVCDSMVYHSVDSVLFMHREPILWNDENQLSANDVNIVFKDDNIHRMNFNGSAFIVSQEDTTRFNQIKGRDMVGLFNSGRLARLNVDGNGETVYFIRDKGEITAVNKAESSRLSIGIRDNKVTSILFRDNPVATLFPIEKAELQDVMLRGFAWHNEIRPEGKGSIIPKNLILNYYEPIEIKANLNKDKKRNPAESLNSMGFK